MRKPYIRKLDRISKLDVWLVDGEFIRKNVNMEFTNIGQHYRFPFIPMNELWIDRPVTPGEEKFFIDHLLVEHRLMSQGADYDEAIEKADSVERAEREKSELVRSIRERPDHDAYSIRRAHKQLIKAYSRELRVWLVRGEVVRGIFNVDFTEGGHDRVYQFIPKNEIWIDDDVPRDERRFVILHEMHEWRLMAQGLPYDAQRNSAHRSASRMEYFCRHHPSRTMQKIRDEMKNVEKLMRNAS